MEPNFDPVGQPLLMMDDVNPQVRGFDPISTKAKTLKCALNCLTFPFTCCLWPVSVPLNERAVISYFNEPELELNPGCYCKPLVGREYASKSITVRDFAISKFEVNDADGNPVKISAVVNWSVVDVYTVTYKLQNYIKLVIDLSKTALRKVASKYPYNPKEKGADSLSQNSDFIGQELAGTLNENMRKLGIHISRFTITDVSFCNNMQTLLLKKQEAKANVEAIEITAHATAQTVIKTVKLLKDGGIEFSEDQSAKLASDLLLVFASGQPVNIFNNLSSAVSGEKGDGV